VEAEVEEPLDLSKFVSKSIMKIRGLLVASLVFFILAGVLYWSDHHKPAANTATASADTPPAILKLDASAITRLDLEKKDAKPIVLAKTGSGEWKISEPQPLGADQTAVSGIVSTLSSLNSQRLVEDKAADLKPYGLDQPAFQLDISEKDNKTQKLLIGDDTPTGGAVYAMLAGDPRVFTVAGYAKTSINKSLSDLRDKRLLTVNPDKISRMELVTKGQHIEFGRNKDEWQILGPKPLRADSFQVSELARKLTDARIDLNGSDTKDVTSAFARGVPLATVKVTDESGIQELQIRKTNAGKTNAVKSRGGQNAGRNDAAYYAKSSAVDGVYKIDSDLGPSLDRGVDDFRDKKLFNFGFADPNKVELRIASKTYSLTRSGDDWWQDGKKMDAGAVQSLTSKLRDFAADKFLDSGFSNPTIDVAVTSEDGKRVEKVLIAKFNDGYLAERENDSSLYHLDSRTVDDLLKTADQIKPSADTTK
jgi:hypothetical protein